jgi:uncharacterized protein (PEP-CTERM system associated)
MGDRQNYRNDDPLNSSGYSLVAGFGVDPVSLFKGEIYGGVQAQYYDVSIGGPQIAPTLGGRLSWSPTSYLTVSGKIAEAFSTSASSSLTPTSAAATKVASAELAVNYALARNWSATARIDFAHTSFIGSSRVDEDWSVGLSGSRQISKNLSLTAEYELAHVSSNVSDANYTENTVTIGLTYFP